MSDDQARPMISPSPLACRCGWAERQLCDRVSCIEAFADDDPERCENHVPQILPGF